MFISIKYKYMILYFTMTIIPIIIIIILIFQLGNMRSYENFIDSNTHLLQLISNVNSSSNLNDTSEQGTLYEDILSDFEIGNQVIYIVDSKGELLYSSGEKKTDLTKLLSKIKEDIPDTKNKGGFQQNVSNEDMIISYYYDEKLDCYYILNTLTNHIQEKTLFIRELTIIIIMVGFISVFSIVLISFYLTRPIRRLSKEIKHKSVSLSEGIIVKDEIWDISIQLNEVYQTLKEQIDKSYNLEIKTNKAQFLNLQSQINPHFLYNTLGTINSIAIIEKVPLIAELTRSLSDMFRYNTEQNNEYVLLKDELEQIKRYLHVQLIRFDGMIRKEIKIDCELLKYKTIKFMLQPIVENCFTHAFENQEEQGLIRIIGYSSNNSIIINVEDNGLIMEQEELNEMNELFKEVYPSQEAVQNKGIGLLNVNTRIKLAFGKEYGLSFHSRQPKGLCVKITLPFKN
ncbi:sensor histidine kinase [Pseudogracilibacillus sp. SO10305]|uniref:sensor histidine kinase n=1 Tax=Pseudogracilibacillus sp. SO10305 TaxID=3098292 RepID=UPI00300E0354